MGRNRRKRKSHNSEQKNNTISTITDNVETNEKTANSSVKVPVLKKQENENCFKYQTVTYLNTSEEPEICSTDKNCSAIETPKIEVEKPRCNISKPCAPIDKEQPSRRYHRDYYLHYLCQVCKTMPEPASRESCAKCKLVTYCSIEHKWTHWPSHKDLCQTLAELFNQYEFENITPDDFRRIRVNIMEKCEKLIKRPMEKYEREIVLYYNSCFSCHERRARFLDSCNVCKHISFCKEHTLLDDHEEHCAGLVLYRKIVLHTLGDNLASLYFPDTFSKELKEKDMLTLCSDETESELECAFLSELATSPLSVVNSLKLMYGNYQKLPRQICIHVIGAENDFELSAIEKWEIFLSHLLPCTDILLVFIGPELFYNNSAQYESCDECEVWGKKLRLDFQFNSFYHQYVQGPHYVKPDMICSFNPGIYRTTGFNKMDSWGETIEQILKQNVPVLVTAYTKVEILKDIERIEQTAKLNLIQAPGQNPFSSLKPFLSFVNDEVSPIIFKNHYHAFFKKY